MSLVSINSKVLMIGGTEILIGPDLDDQDISSMRVTRRTTSILARKPSKGLFLGMITLIIILF
tara:strand:- start:1469 stop:1657 length:189 start_codon:yes stop_codon:yes gene_type:complete